MRTLKISRRRALELSAGVAASAFAPALRQAHANDVIESHGMSAFGDLGYPADFPHFRYVNPDAPKGGRFSQIGQGRIYNQNFLTFNSLNSFILKGDAAQGMELTFATLMVRAGDEPDPCMDWRQRRCAVRPTASPINSQSGRRQNSTMAHRSPHTTSPSR
jgi:microcin C transport system substrate-binding protein